VENKDLKIEILPAKTVIKAQNGENLYELLISHGVLLEGDCGGRGTCRRCAVRLIQGALYPAKDEEAEKAAFGETAWKAGWRLACLHQVQSDLQLYIPNVGEDKSKLSAQVRQEKAVSSLVQGLGLVVDAGTTSIAAGLVDASTGAVLGLDVSANSQRAFGADVVSRIDYTEKNPQGLYRLQKAVWGDIEKLAVSLSVLAGVESGEIKSVMLAGNAVMSHLLWGVDPSSLARAPFTALINKSEKKAASQLPLKELHPQDIYLLPNIGGYIGSDTVAAMLATGLTKKRNADKWTMLIDIGTNGELVLAGRGRMLVASAAAGPAFEGAQIHCGMRATAGAIYDIEINKDSIIPQVIGKVAPQGICGSGLIAIAARLRKFGILDKSGRLSGNLAYISKGEEGRQLFLGSDEDGGRIILTQRDIRQLQMAKAAIRAASRMLLAAAGAKEEDIGELILAGAFGASINSVDALDIGLLPNVEEKKITFAGNAAWEGAYKALVDRDIWQEANRLVRETEYVSLSGNEEFSRFFIEDMVLE